MSPNDFMERIALSRLLTTEQITALRHQVPGFRGTTRDMAACLVQQNILTAYQARHLLAGRAMGFFLSKYRIQEPLGQGGMGFVLRVVDTMTSRQVALKLLPHEATRDPERVARFHREARAAMKLQHPNIVQTFELGQEGQLHFIAMELVEGRTLKELIAQNGQLAPEQAVHVISQIALALQCAEEQGIVHRDIKPSNILVTPDGHAKLLDLGLARFSNIQTDESSLVRPLTLTGHMMGTVDFVAPEQAEDPREANACSDIYSLGCTLYQCLTGHVPFPDGTFVQKLLKHRQDDAIRPSRVVPGLDPGLSRVVEQMMEKKPEDRLPTATAVIKALSEFESIPAVTEQAAQQPQGKPAATAAVSPVPFSPDLTSAAGQTTHTEVFDNITAVSPLDNLLLMRKRRNWSPRKVISWVTVIVVWMLIAGLWNWVVSGQGTVVISLSEIPDSRVLFELDGRPFPINGAGGQATVIGTGLHRLSVSSQGYGQQTLSFEVERNQRHELQVV
ncbi:MAG: serine/threonine-protein kinase, partial [Planctomycetaceae bacterium]